jgi:hypothetical protein
VVCGSEPNAAEASFHFHCGVLEELLDSYKLFFDEERKQQSPFRFGKRQL